MNNERGRWRKGGRSVQVEDMFKRPTSRWLRKQNHGGVVVSLVCVSSRCWHRRRRRTRDERPG